MRVQDSTFKDKHFNQPASGSSCAPCPMNPKLHACILKAKGKILFSTQEGTYGPESTYAEEGSYALYR